MTLSCKRCCGSGKEPDYKKIGSELRDLRRKHKITAVAIADDLGFSASYITDLELGRRSINSSLESRYKRALEHILSQPRHS